MEYYAQPEPETPRTYRGPRALAARYRKLEPQAVESAGQGFDIERAYLASHDAGGNVSNWTPLDGADELATIRSVMRLAQQDMERDHEQHARWWRCWWAVRVLDVSPSLGPADYSRRRVYEVLELVDEYIEGAMAWLEVLDARDDPAPRVRLAVNPRAFEEEEDANGC